MRDSVVIWSKLRKLNSDILHIPDSAFRIPDYAVPAFFTIFAFIMAVGSSGFFELDELAHFMKSRDSWSDWRNLLDIWGRPLCTVFFSTTAPLGIAASRCLAVAVAFLTACGTASLASLFVDERSHRTTLIWLLLFAQPMFLLQSFAVMTEMLIACLWVWALALLLRGRIEAAGLLVGLGGLARPEGWLAILCWPVFLQAALTLPTLNSFPADHAAFVGDSVRRRSWSRTWIISVFLSILPCFLWWLAGWMAYHDISWFVRQWPWSPRSRYGKTPLKFLFSLLVASAFWMVVPLGYGIRDWVRRTGSSARARQALLFVAVPFLAVVALHAVLGTLGLFGSLSLPRYFVIVAPMIAILSAQGLYAYGRNKPTGKLNWALIPGLSLCPMVLLLLAGQLPIPTNTQFQRMEEAVAYAQQQAVRADVDAAEITAAHPYVYYRLNLPLDSDGHRRALKPGGLEAAAPGTVVITENVIWEFDGFPGRQELESWGYRLRKTWSDSGEEKRALPGLSSLMSQHLLSLVGDAARVQVWIKEKPR